MRISLTCLVFLTVIRPACATQAEAKSQQSAEQEILRLEQDWAEALRTRDKAYVARILAEDYRGVRHDGGLDTRADELKKLDQADHDVFSIKLGEMRVRVYGNAAVVDGLMTLESKAREPKRGQFRFTDVWLMQRGKWRCVSSHSTQVAKSHDRQ